ncbi:hypothetical protein V1517DRAFT_334153 [Lipomyces orientalis]|uniref:Uncharacterized protein n=1 Tax=Lipomyces orientalis TaxID=1233043 RepID=A0ACC3TCU4_9ASCO
MSVSRSADRNVHFFDSLRPTEPLGGLYLNPSVTRRKFLRMLESIIDPDCHYSVWLRGTEAPLMPTDVPLEQGNYDIVSDSPGGIISLTDERCITRAYTRTNSRRDRRFRDQVRARDGKCVITGNVNLTAHRNYWSGFEAVHIFPLSHEEFFKTLNYPQLITIRSGEADTGINSCQNGLLMQSNIHQQFESFGFGIDPDDGYKITCFMEDTFRLDERTLDLVCRDPADERSVRDELLRWHFRQAILANMKGNGEPVFLIFQMEQI